LSQLPFLWSVAFLISVMLAGHASVELENTLYQFNNNSRFVREFGFVFVQSAPTPDFERRRTMANSSEKTLKRLPKPRVAGSNPVARSTNPQVYQGDPRVSVVSHSPESVLPPLNRSF
jgi:hypothetical protein